MTAERGAALFHFSFAGLALPFKSTLVSALFASLALLGVLFALRETVNQLPGLSYAAIASWGLVLILGSSAHVNVIWSISSCRPFRAAS